MSYPSFEEALRVCLEAEPGSAEQDAALLFCLEHAPQDLKARLREAFLASRDGSRHGQGCGCSHSEGEEHG